MEKYVKFEQPLYVKVAMVLISLALLLWGLSLGAGLLVPLSFSFLFALLLHPLSARLESWKVPRVLAIFICLIVIIAALVGIMYFIVSQLMNFGDDLPELQARFNQLLAEIQGFIAERFGVNETRQLDWLRKQASGAVASSGALLSGTLSATTSTFADLSLVPIFIFFFLYYRNFFMDFLNRVFASTPNESIMDVGYKVQAVVKNHIMGLFLVIVILAALNTVGLLLLGIKYAFFFGALAAFLNIIPYLGILIGSVLPITMALLTKDSIWYAVGVAAVFAFVQFLEGNFITPNIVGSKVGVNPLAAIVALILGGMIWGVAGMILSIPFTAILKVIFDHVPGLEPFGFLLGEPPKEQVKPHKDVIDEVKETAKEAVRTVAK
ncbi:MAG: AI-2E family transporter [Cytophagales bacterium]|nr:AI-2E family transporter [Cytophagales bacterium]